MPGSDPATQMDRTYRLVIGLSRLLFRLLELRIIVEGDEHVPPEDAAILVSNHVSFLDFIFVGLAARRRHRFVRFLTRYDAWHNVVAGPALTAMRHVPVDRAAPVGAYLEARAALRSGEVVGIFPEAGISTSFTVRALMRGAVALSRDTGAPIMLVAVWGPQRISTVGARVSLRRGRPITISVSPPVEIPDDLDVTAATVELGRQLQRLVEDTQLRHPDQPRRGVPDRWHPAHLGGDAPTADEAGRTADVPRSAVHPPAADAMF